MLTILKGVNLGVLFFVELGAVIALCLWGFVVGPNLPLKILLGLGAPAMAIVVWALFGAPRSSRQFHGVAYHALQVVVFGAGALALVAAGQPGLGIGYAIVALVSSAAIAIWRG